MSIGITIVDNFSIPSLTPSKTTTSTDKVNTINQKEILNVLPIKPVK